MATPTLGYPTRTAAVQALIAIGMSPAAIAVKIGITENAVSGLISSANRTRRVADLPYGTRAAGPIDETVKRKLRPHAAKRGLSVETLIQRILATVADDGLVTAILDDGEAEAA